MSLTKEVKINKKENSQTEVQATVAWKDFSAFRKEAVDKIGATLEMDGFRKGHVPEKVIVDKFGEMFVLTEAANILINQIYPEIIIENSLRPVGRPEISISKIAPENDLEFKIMLFNYPQVKLPNYKKIASKIMPGETKVKIEDKEIDALIEQIKKTAPGAPQGPEGEAKEKDSEPDQKEFIFDDAFVQKIGDFKNVADFREKMKRDMQGRKEQEEREKKRLKAVEAILEETPFSVPDILIESEQERMIAQMKDDITKMGMDFERYLQDAKKTEEEVREEWKGEAEKRAKVDVILKEIAKAEKMKISEEKIKEQVDKILEQNDKLSRVEVSLYVENVMLNEEVMQFLEAQK